MNSTILVNDFFHDFVKVNAPVTIADPVVNAGG
jgi:hypothetical protein